MADFLPSRHSDGTASCIVIKPVDIVGIDRPNGRSFKAFYPEQIQKGTNSTTAIPSSGFLPDTFLHYLRHEQAIDWAAVPLSSDERHSSLVATGTTREPYATSF